MVLATTKTSTRGITTDIHMPVATYIREMIVGMWNATGVVSSVRATSPLSIVQWNGCVHHTQDKVTWRV